MTLYLAMGNELLVVRQHNQKWQVEPQLVGLQVMCLAIDPFYPERVYCGTYRRGLWRSEDAGHSWLPVGDAYTQSAASVMPGIAQEDISAVAVSPIERSNGYGVVYAGTEMSHMYRSDDGGESWHELTGIRALPSSSTWRFPPKPSTNHARWITPDSSVAGRVYVAVEAGALVQTPDGGQTWVDRVSDGPFDTHTLFCHPAVPDRLYSAAGDGFMTAGKGYQESLDGGKTWQYPDEGLQHHYLYGLAVDPADPDTILVSAATSPQVAHHPYGSESFVYRKTKGQPWQMVTNGLPETIGCMVAAFGTTPAEPNVFYLLSNKGCYRSPDGGQHWERLDLPWNERLVFQHPQSLAITQV
jgi:photosystem II stability/assembly factor-like uncharacterized protein